MFPILQGDAPTRVQRCCRGVAVAMATCLLLAPSLPAQQDRALTLDAVHAMVAARSPRVRAASALSKAVSARVPGTLRLPDPQVQLGFMNYAVPAFRPDATLGMTQLQVMQMVPLPGKLSAAGAAARAQVAVADARVGVAAWDARGVATMAFHDLWLARASVGVTAETRALLQEAAAVAVAMYRSGEGGQGDVLRAQVEVARMDDELIRLAAMEAVATSKLAAAADTSADALTGTPVLPSVPDTAPPLGLLESRVLDGRPDLRVGEAGVRAATAAMDVARRERWPDLQVGMQYGQRRGEMGIDRMGSLMVGASIPLYAGSRQLAMRDEADAMRQMAVADLAEMRAETRARVAAVHAELRSAQRLRDLYHTTVLPQATAAAEGALAAYRSGRGDFMAVIDTRMAVNRYRLEQLNIRASEGRAWADIEMLLGRPFTELASRPSEASHD